MWYIILIIILFLNEFLGGSLKHSGTFDEEYPLADYLNRLQELLGITIENDGG